MSAKHYLIHSYLNPHFLRKMNSNTVVGATQFGGAGKWAQNSAARGYGKAQKGLGKQAAGLGKKAKAEGKAIASASKIANKAASLQLKKDTQAFKASKKQG